MVDRDHSVATNCVVHGTLFSFEEEDTWPTIRDVLHRIDPVEGVNQSNPEQGMYKRVLVTVQDNDGNNVLAWCYVVTDKTRAEFEDAEWQVTGDFDWEPASRDQEVRS